eukprot:gene2277-4427_t
MTSPIQAIPRAAWSRNLGDPDPPKSVHSFSRPPIFEALSLLPVAYRVGSYLYTERKAGREPIFDLNGIFLEPPTPGPYGGVPLGGIGGGSICRGYRGDFRRWSLFPGKYIHNIVHADQFSIRVKRGAIIYSQVLSIFDGTLSDGMRTWKWSLPPDSIQYHGLFPRAWTVYTNPVPLTTVIIRQISPVIPNNYTDTCLPTAVFHVEVENLGDDAEVSVMFTFQNGYGGDETDPDGGYTHLLPSQDKDDYSSFCCGSGSTYSSPSLSTSSSSNSLEKSHFYDKGSFAIAACYDVNMISDNDNDNNNTDYNSTNTTNSNTTTADESKTNSINKEKNNPSNKSNNNNNNNTTTSTNDNICEITTCPMFTINGKITNNNSNNSNNDDNNEYLTANQIWDSFTHTGALYSQNILNNDPPQIMRNKPSAIDHTVAAAVCIKKTIKTGEKGLFSFSLVWDHPIVRFGSGHKVTRYYTKFFGDAGSISPLIATYALKNCDRWEKEIFNWQLEVQQDENLPEYYKHMLFNELYYLVDGGTIWSIDGVDKTSTSTTGTVTAAVTSSDKVNSPSSNKSTTDEYIAINKNSTNSSNAKLKST